MWKKWIIASLVIVILAGLAASAQWWLPPLLAFVIANTDLIQGLTDLVQLALWVFAGLATLVGLWRTRKQQPAPPVSTVEAGEGAIVAKDSTVATGQLAVGQDFYGDVILIADPAQLWPLIGQNRPPQDLRRATESYLKYLVDRYRYLDFKGMGVSDRILLRLPLLEMYVPLKARIEMPEGDTWARELRLAGRQLGQAEVEAIGRRLSKP